MGTSIYIGTTEFDGSKVYNIYFKKKLNQIGIFEFDVIEDALSATDLTLLTVNTIIQIVVEGTIRFEGFIKKITEDKGNLSWHIEGESLEGILGTRTTRTPVTVRSGVNQTTITGKGLVQQLVFRFGGFATTGDTGWSIIGGNGIDTWFYKLESRAIVDHISNIAKLSGYDWRVYLDTGA